MTPEEWQKIRPLLESALEMDPAYRTAYLDDACADRSLRREVESLIAVHDQAGTDSLSFGPVPGFDTQDEPRFRLPPGKRIGAYEVLEEIAVGGMGAVYRAVRADGQYQQQVALKIVRSELGAEFTSARFKNERQILANLDHPNIAKILDGGSTADGLPYFVMELIGGRRVDEYCDTQGLPTNERLDLFLQVCSAVQYAHQRLIIHRDIKPGNILVNADGVPKLLDFGIAKILESGDLATQPDQTISVLRLLTPEYASPEQVKGESITTASDIYSLGVVLYELLTGRTPYNLLTHTPHEVCRAVCEAEPEKPSTAVRRTTVSTFDKKPGSPDATGVGPMREGFPGRLSKRLRGDLDNIVLMALRKDPHRRYGSVEQFAQDIRRHLEHLPVTARRDTMGYRTSKFVARNKVGVAATGVVTMMLLAGLIVTLREARIARAESARAEQRFNDVRELARSNLFELHDAIQQLPGSAPARHLVIQRSLQYLDKLSQEAAGNHELLRELAVGYEKIAGLQGNFSGPGIGDSKAALASYQKALSIRDEMVASSKDDLRELKAELPLLGGYFRCSLSTGRTDEASRIARRELSIAEEVVQKQPQDSGARADAARAHLHLSTVMGGSGSSPSTREIPEAILHDRKAIDILTQLAMVPGDARIQRALTIARLALAFHTARARKFEESAQLFDEIVSDQKSLPTSRDTQLTFNYRGLMFDRRGDWRRALVNFQAASRIVRSLLQADPRDLVAQIDIDILEGDAAIEEARLGNKSAALTELKTAIEDGERLLASNTSESFYKSLLIIGYSYQAEILSLMGDRAGAQANYSHALATAAAVSQDDPQDLESRLSIAKIHAAKGVVFARAAQYADAQREFSASLDFGDKLLRTRPADAETLYISASVRNSVAAIRHCRDRSPCQGASQLQFPDLNN